MALLKCSQVMSIVLLCTMILAENSIHAAPNSEQVIASSQSDDLDSGVYSEKDDLQSSSSIGYGYYSYPYLSGGFYGGYNPYYGGIYGLAIGYYTGYPYYGGYYGGHHGFHGHYW